MKKLQSRKLWAMVAMVLGTIATALSGEVTWTNAIMACAGIVATYLAGQSYVDGKKAVAPIEVNDMAVTASKSKKEATISIPLSASSTATITLKDGYEPVIAIDGITIDDPQLPKDILPGGKLWPIVSKIKIKL